MRNKQDWFNAKLSSVSPEIRTEIQLSADIIARIDSILKEKNMSQRDLARKMGKSVNGNQKCSDFGNSECSIFGIKTTVLLASAVQ